MSAPTVSVVVRVSAAGGDPVAGARVLAQLSGVVAYQGLIVPDEIFGVTDAAGLCTLQLFPNELGDNPSRYTVSIIRPGVRTRVVYAVIPDDSPVDLDDCLVSDGPAPQRISAAVLAVNGDTGSVRLDASNLPLSQSNPQTIAQVLDGLGTAASLDVEDIPQPLTAGPNITIENGVISAAPGEGLPGGMNAIPFGGSQDARCSFQLDGLITVAAGVATIQLEAGHICHDEALVSVGLSNPQTVFDKFKYTGPMTRVGSQTISVPAVGWPNGNGQTSVRFIQHHASPSWVRRVNDAMNGGFPVISNLAQGGERTADKIDEYQLIDAYEQAFPMGSWSTGNDVNELVDPAGTLSRLATMFNYHTARGRPCLIYTPPATPQLTPTQMSYGRAVNEGVAALARDNPLLFVVDGTNWVVDPLTGQGDPKWFLDPANIHFQRDATDVLGTLIVAALLRKFAPLPDPLVASIYDRRSADANSRQIAEGFWTLADTVDASTLDARAQGEAFPGFSAVQITPGALATWSRVLRDDRRGYDQRIVLTGPADAGITLDYIGPPGQTLAQRLLIGKQYDVCCTLKVLQGAPGALGTLEHFAIANLAYSGAAGNVNARLTSHCRTPTHAIPPMLRDVIDVPAIFPRFKVPAAAVQVNNCRQTLTLTKATAAALDIRLGRLTWRQVD